MVLLHWLRHSWFTFLYLNVFNHDETLWLNAITKWHALSWGHFSNPCCIQWKPRLWFQRRRVFSTVSNHIRYKQNQSCHHALILNSSLTPVESSTDSSTSPTWHEGVWVESPLKRKPGCVIAIQKQNQYIPLKFIPIRRLAKNIPGGVSCLLLYDACAYVASLLCSEPADKTASAERSG